jgi:hypothetical protein
LFQPARAAIFDREEIVSFSPLKEAIPKKGFSQQILGSRPVGLRVQASRLGVNPKQSSFSRMGVTPVGNVSRLAGTQNNLGSYYRVSLAGEDLFSYPSLLLCEGNTDGGHWESSGKMAPG